MESVYVVKEKEIKYLVVFFRRISEEFHMKQLCSSALCVCFGCYVLFRVHNNRNHSS